MRPEAVAELLTEGLRRRQAVDEIREENESLLDSGDAPVSVSLERTVSDVSARGRARRSSSARADRRPQNLAATVPDAPAKAGPAKGAPLAVDRSAERPNLSRLSQREDTAEPKRTQNVRSDVRPSIAYAKSFGRSFPGLSRLLASSADKHRSGALPFARTLRAPSSRSELPSSAFHARNTRKSAHSHASDARSLPPGEQ